jgi:hypothetical protein
MPPRSKAIFSHLTDVVKVFVFCMPPCEWSVVGCLIVETQSSRTQVDLPWHVHQLSVEAAVGHRLR